MHFIGVSFALVSTLKGEWVAWNGSTSTDFEVGSNWSTGSIPTNNTSSDTARFTSVPSNMPSLTTNRSIAGMDFTVGGVTVNGNYDLTFGGDGIDSSGSGTNVVNFNPVQESGDWVNWQIGSGNRLTVNGNLKGSANSIVFGTSSGGTLDLNGSNNTYNSKINLRGDNHQRITVNITGAMDNITQLKVGDTDANTDNGKATLNLSGSGASIVSSGAITVADRFEGIMNVSSGADVVANNFTNVGYLTGANGTLSLDGSGTTYTQANSQLRIGFNATGTLNVSNSALVSTPTKQTYIGASNGSSGTMLIESGSTFTGDRIFIGSNSGSTGTVTVTGSGTTLTSDNKLYVGNQGTGTMTISNSADVTSSDETILGSTSSGNGTLTVRGSGSTFTGGSNFKVGADGTGTMTIEDSAAVSVTNNKDMTVAANSGSTGTLNVYTNATLSSYKLLVGNQGAGTMIISGSADVTAANATTIGATSNASGTLTVTGSGSTLTSGSDLKVGNQGTGTLNITDSASVTINNNAHTFIGSAAGSTGTLNVDTGASLNAARLNIGNNGTGTMTVSGSADVVSTNQVILGVTSNGTGTLTVTGSGSTLRSDHIMKIGADGNGTFNIEDSAVVTVNNNRDTYVGNQSGGVGIFNIKTGATLNANKIYIGNQSGGSGTMTVSGSGTVANASNRIQIGVNGGGGVKSELHIDSGAVVNDAHSAGTKLWDGGIIEFNGGTLNSNSGFGNVAGSTIRGDGTLNVNTGTFYLNGVVFDGSAGETLHISGKIGNGSNSSATLTKNGAGTLKLSYDNIFSRAVNVNAGTILIEHEDALGENNNNNANSTTTVASGATLALNNASAMTVYENLVISGTGASNTGAVDVVDGSHTIAGTVTLAGNSTIDVSSSDDTLTISQVVSGSSNTLNKTGAGALTLSNNNTYTGNTTVSQGTLNLTGSIDGNLVVNGGTATGGTNANAVSGALTLSSGAISPNTTGTRGVYNIKGSGTSTWTGGSYIWDVSGGMGSSGTDSDSNGYYEASGASDGTLYDILAFSGALDFNGSSANSITIDVNSYGSYTGYQWETPTEIKIATAASISNFNEAFFNIDSSGFNDATGAWWLDWGITSHGNALWLTYNAVPETSTWVMILTLPLLILLKFLHYKKIQKKISSED